LQAFFTNQFLDNSHYIKCLQSYLSYLCNVQANIVEVNVSNPITTLTTTSDTTLPQVSIINPVPGSVADNVTITVNASDDSGASGIALAIYIDGSLKETGNGSTLSTRWNTRPKSIKAGAHTIKAVARDAAGNTAFTTVEVTVIK
jgi:thermitase